MLINVPRLPGVANPDVANSSRSNVSLVVGDGSGQSALLLLVLVLRFPTSASERRGSVLRL